MKKYSLPLLLALFTISNCDCEEPLQNVCPVSEACYVQQGYENIEENIITGKELENYSMLGICSFGITSCDENYSIYCKGITYPSEEVCDNLDNNCNGQIDEGYDVDLDGYTVCSGDCNDLDANINPDGIEICNGLDDDCDGVLWEEEIVDNDGDGVIKCLDCNDSDFDINSERLEICDGKDNNCDGEIDNNVIEVWQSCGPESDNGVCKNGTNVCSNGELYCVGAEYPSEEVCDGLDNDCDGLEDEELTRGCFNECGAGIEYCFNGFYQGCTAPLPIDEVCDGIDNDCDGEIDEGCACVPGSFQLCTNGVVDVNTLELINCGVGITFCDIEGVWGPCMFVSTAQESCNNWDDDCDGIVDGMVEICGNQLTAGIGECKLGERVCESGEWTGCLNAINPEEEVCDQKDNDCDGEIDEDLDPHEKVDMVFAFDGSGSMCPYKDALLEGISLYVADFANSQHMFGLIVFPEQYDYDAHDPHKLMTSGLVNVYEFISILNSIECNWPALEPSLDVVYDLASITPNVPTGIEWREDAYPYIIMMTDEEAQTWAGLTSFNVAEPIINCQIGECEPGDKVEMYVMTLTQYYSGWEPVVYYDPDRLLNLHPPVGERYTELLREVFTNVCLGF